MAQNTPQDQLHALIAASPLAVVGIDRESQVTLWNPAAEQIFGWSSEEAVGARVPFVDEARLAEHVALRERVLAGESLVDIEGTRRRKDGSLVLLSLNVAPIRDAAGQATGMVAMLAEIGERKRLAEELEAHRHRLAELVEARTAELSAANRRLAAEIRERREMELALVRSERLAAVGTLASGVAHEFNNASAIVLGFTQLAEGLADGNQPLQTYLSRIRAGALRVRGTARKLLDFAGQSSSRRSSGNLSTIVGDTLELVRPELESVGVVIETQLAEVPDTLLDASGIGQLVLNLLINARDALLDQPVRRITIETGARTDRVWVRVTDTGCGIPPEHIPQIFTPFFSTKGEHAKGRTPQSRARGTGLGLSISHTAARNHGGALTVESGPDRGSSFTLFLPIREPLAPEPSPEATAGVGGGRVVIVDDEPDLRELLGVWLRSVGYQTTTTDDASEVLRWIAAGEGGDVVLLDLQMPKMSGAEFLRRAARLGPRRPKVIVITGRTQSNVEVSGLEVYDTLLKPFALEELKAKVERAVARHRD
jgi:PAS domain S-box-containing protein